MFFRIYQYILDLFRGTSLGGLRSYEWDRVRKEFLIYHDKCEVCEKETKLNVHHQKPFHIYPAKELEMSNLITLCREHHYLFGHLLNWKSWNENIQEDAKIWNEKIKNRKVVK